MHPDLPRPAPERGAHAARRPVTPRRPRSAAVLAAQVLVVEGLTLLGLWLLHACFGPA